MDYPVISVIMSHYNTPVSYLTQAIQSVLNQTYQDFEFIIIDDASSDVESAQYLSSLSDPRIVTIRNGQNLGLTKSLNVALRAAKGKYIARMDSDDICLPERFSRQIAFMESHPDVIVCGTWFEKFGEDSEIRMPRITSSAYYRCQLLFSNTPVTMCHPSVMMRKELLARNGIQYDERIKKSQDYAMWVKCSEYGEMAILEEVLLRYRVHQKQISSMSNEEQLDFSKMISNEQFDRLGIPILQDEMRYRQNLFGSADDYLRCREWFDKIEEANRKRTFLDTQILHQYLDDRYINLIKHIRRPMIIIRLFFKLDNRLRKRLVGICTASVRHHIKFQREN